jgi:WD40 repeat protein
MIQSPDGSLLAVPRFDRTGYLLIDSASGSTVADVTTSEEDQIPYFGLAFDPTGSTLAVTHVSTEDESVPAVQLFDVASNRLIGSLTGPPGEYGSSTQFDPTGRWLAALGPTEAVAWDVTAGGDPRSFGPAFDLELTPDGRSIVVWNPESFKIFDLNTGEQIREIDTPAGIAYWDFELDATGTLAALVSPAAFGRRVDVIDIVTGELRKTLTFRDPYYAQFSPDGSTLAVTSEDSLIRLYDTAQFVERDRLAGTSGTPSLPFFTPDGSRLASSSVGQIRIWDISRAGAPVLGNFEIAGAPLDRLVVAADESTAFATVYPHDGLRSSVQRVDTRSGAQQVLLSDVPYYFSTRPLVSPDLSVVATLTDDGVSDLINLSNGETAQLARCETVRAFDQGGRVAAVDAFLLCFERGQETGSMSRIVDLRTGDTLFDLEGIPIYAAAFGPPGDDGLPRRVVVERAAAWDVTLYDIATGEALGTYVPDADWAVSIAMSPDGERLAMLMGSGRLVVFDVAKFADGDDQTNPEIFDIPAHNAGSKAVAFSNSGLIATASSLDGVRVWSRDGEPVTYVPTHQEDAPTFAFAPGTDTLYYEDGDGVVRRFPIDVGELTELARSLLRRGFTEQECDRYFPGEECPTFDA